MSGFPGSFEEQVLYRKPCDQSALRKTISGVVSRDRTLRMIAETSRDPVAPFALFPVFMRDFEAFPIAP